MKTIYLLPVLFFINISFSQNKEQSNSKYTTHNKGKFYIYWGGNRETYSDSDITFKGDNYNFTVENAQAEDKPKGWHVDYINPTRMTIPQTNFRLGYFISDKYNISVGLDHMKYVVTQSQIASVSGYVNLPSSEAGSIYNGTYNNTPVDLSINYDGEDQNPLPPFLTFEHTDGLNYVNSEFSRVDDFSKYLGITNTDKIQINLTEGVGAGLLFPKTNARILGYQRHDEFHVSGFGVSAKAGLNFTFFKHYFLQTELKGGYINMNNIRTTNSTSDSAEQDFFFLQTIIAFGGIFKI
ncbi:MAG: hypothetical protein JNJ52_02565 [Flavobacterium sp.]|nr:hypothetical protein [Flavobacterium sp.]